MIRLAALLCLVPMVAGAVSCRDLSFEGSAYTVCEVDPARESVDLYLRDDAGAILGGFVALARHVAPRELVFAMNGGMYHPDRSPVGLYVEDGAEQMRVITAAGPGNFGLLPNGVLCLRAASAEIWESRAFAAARPSCRAATQSGPMLVLDGALHPRFIRGSDSLNIRNGVGLRGDGVLVFAISNVPVNFHEFARLFRDRLGAPDALFLDGRVSRLHAADLGRSDFGFAPLGPMIAVTR